MRLPASRLSLALAACFVFACGARSELGASEGSGSGAGGAGSSHAQGSGASSTSSGIGTVGAGASTVASTTSSIASSSSASSTSVSSSSSSSSSASSSGAGGASSSSTGVGGSPVSVGCSDGTREGFLDMSTHPMIAACSGGWDQPGILDATSPSCGRHAGNSSANPSGFGCGAADLCAQGFHVCAGADDVAAHSPSGCAGAAPPGPGLFFATRQGSTGCAICALGTSTDPTQCTGCSCAQGCATTSATANDLFGCGSIGDTPNTCGPLDRFSNDLCQALGPPWKCGNDGCREAQAVTKASSAHGGVLCCAD